MRKKIAQFTSLIVLVIVIVISYMFLRNLGGSGNLMYAFPELPKNYNGAVVAFVSDINKCGSSDISNVSKANPDLIVVGGDATSTSKISKLSRIAPVYFTSTAVAVDEASNTYNISDTPSEFSRTDLTAKEYLKNTYLSGGYIVEQAEKGDAEAISYMEYITESLEEGNTKKLRIFGVNSESDEVSFDNKLIAASSEGYGEVNIAVINNPEFAETISNYGFNLVFANNASKSVKSGIQELNGVTVVVSDDVEIVTLSDGNLHEYNILERFFSLFIKDVGTIYDNDGGFQKHVYEYKDDEHLHF